MLDNLGYSKITVDTDGIYLDGHFIEALKIGKGVTVEHYGDDVHKVTLSLYTEQVEITAEAKRNGDCGITETNHTDTE